jgi:hypothetical protein
MRTVASGNSSAVAIAARLGVTRSLMLRS